MSTKKFFNAIFLILAAFSFTSGLCANEYTAKQQHEALGLVDLPKARYEHTTHPDAQWFGEGNLGLFLHWGISSVNANNEISWAMLANINWNPRPIAPTKYWAQAEEFNPQNYDPEKWIKAAKDAGFTYAVLTTRHHDGYAMWPSEYGDLNIGMFTDGVDLVRPFVDACHKYGLKVGLYFSGGNWRLERGYRSYSLTSDGSEEKPHLDVNYQPTTLKPRGEELQKLYKEVNSGQLEELLTNYGRIDIIWFDSGPATVTREQIHKWQPGIIINNRSEIPPDYDSSFEGGHLPEQRPGGWWEACQTAVGSWAYQKALDKQAMQASEILSRFIQIRTWGGNFLINFAPRADGTMPDMYYQRMKEIQSWMEDNRRTVIGSEGGPYPENCNVPITSKGRTWFLHALPDFKEETIVLAGVPEPKSVSLLETGTELEYKFDATRLEIKLPEQYRSEMPDVVQVDWCGQDSAPVAAAIQAEPKVESKSDALADTHAGKKRDIGWYEDAGLGLFLHWGISSAHPEGSIEISWSMIKDWHSEAMTPNEYFKLAEVFNPEQYDPDKWCRAAAKAGFKYAVLTARHHDGYALWPSEYGNFSTKQYMNGRDLVGEFIEACRNNGLKAGLYYSPPDWYYNREYMSFRLGTEGFDLWSKTNPDGKPLGVDHEEIELKKMSDQWIQRYKEYMKGQVVELLTNYGKIDLLWFDYNFGGYIGITMEEILEISPDTVVNHRLHGKGDFLTFEGAFPKEKPPHDVWEMCIPIGPGWAHRKSQNHKTAAEFLEMFVKVRSMGGNFLPNFAPGPEGTFSDVVYDRLDKIAEWVGHSGQSVFNTEGLYWQQLCNYPLTASKDGKSWYVHFTPGEKPAAKIISDKKPRAVNLLRTGEDLSWEPTDKGLAVELPDQMKTDLVDTVKIVW